MLSPELEGKLREAGLALDGATSGNIIELCKQYLAVLAEYRSELYRLPDTLKLRPGPASSSSSREDIKGVRKAVRSAIERTTQERRQTEALLFSFTAISGYGAVMTLNRHKYEGGDDWQLSSGGVSLRDGSDGKRMTIQEAVETASLLRREEHVAGNAVVAGARRTVCQDISGSEPEPQKEVRDDNL
jgi:hypothetical protein